MFFQKPKIEIKNDTLVLALCGKSSTGKSSLARWLCDNLEVEGLKNNLVVSDTTRPPRAGEVDGVDYNFIRDIRFKRNINNNYYLEYAVFRDWYYGIPYSRIQQGYVNIVVVNPRGLESLIKLQKTATVIPIYLDASWLTRLQRSIAREHRFKFEYVRRLFADRAAFRNIKNILNRFTNSVYIENSNSDSIFRIGRRVNYLLGYVK